MVLKKYNLYLEKTNEFNFEYNLSKPEKIMNFCNSCLKINKESQEVLYLIGMDSKLNINGVFEISRGNINCNICSPMEILKRLVLSNSNNYILIHNHFSDITPSKEDIQMYHNLKKLNEIIDIKIMDSIIVQDNKYYSFFENSY